jgi:uncharacterized membrane protein
MPAENIFVIIAYPDESRARDAAERLQTLGIEDLIDVERSAFISKEPSGKVSVKPAHRGVLGGMFKRHAHQPAAEEQAAIEETAQQLEPGEAALYLTVSSVQPERVVPELSRYGGKVVKTSLPSEREDLLRRAFDEQMSSKEIADRLGR